MRTEILMNQVAFYYFFFSKALLRTLFCFFFLNGLLRTLGQIENHFSDLIIIR